ncbi:MAG TPA: class F sortase [Arthrobacter sp.]
MGTSLFTAGAVAIAAALALAGPAQAAESDAQLSVLHGVPGLTVDVWVNGERTLDDRLATPLAPAPRFLTVEGTTIDMPIVEVGVSPDGAMEIPEPFNQAGWYRFGPAPGAAAGSAVVGVELMAKDAFDGASIFRRDGPPQLKLVTCGGRWLDEQQDYGDNVIVTAVPA